ncbi:MAG: WbuC family cupin fold metalloprotein [Acidiferrobacterales bacterium]
MNEVQLIDQTLLDTVSRMARESSRRRKNHNFHATDDDASHRLLNAMEPDSYIQPHRHGDPAKDETIIALRGRIGIVFFDSSGAVTGTSVLGSAGPTLGLTIPHGVFHTLVALAPGTVFFETKAGPYRPLTAEEQGAWSPAEQDAAAPGYRARLARLFGA